MVLLPPNRCFIKGIAEKRFTRRGVGLPTDAPLRNHLNEYPLAGVPLPKGLLEEIYKEELSR
jgi:hypothetical protein